MKHKFSKNNNYYTVCVYVIVTVLICTIGVKLIVNIDETANTISNIFNVISPFIFGMFIAYIINPLAELISLKFFKPVLRIKSVTIRKIISVILSYIIVIGAIVALLFYIVPQVVDSLSQINNFISTAQTGFNKLLKSLKDFGESHPNWDIQPVYSLLENIPKKVSEFITNALPELLPAIFSTSVSFIGVFIDGIIAIIVSIYMLMDKPKLINNTKKLVYSVCGVSKGDKIITTAGECNKIFGDYIIGKMIDSLIIGIICWCSMAFLELPYPLMISLIVGITNMIPYFGPFIGAIPGVVLLLIVDIPYALIFALLIFIIQQFDGLYLGPKILGESTGIRPIWIIFAITVGGSIAGMVGMFLGVPVVAVISYLLDKAISNKIAKREITFDTDEESGIITRSDLIVDDTE